MSIDVLKYVGGIVLTAIITFLITRHSFHRQRKVTALDAMRIYLSTQKAHIPDREGYQKFHLNQKDKIPIEYAKLEPFIGWWLKRKYQKAWQKFCDIKYQDLDDAYQSRTKHHIRQQLDELANHVSESKIKQPRDILIMHYELLSQSLKVWF